VNGTACNKDGPVLAAGTPASGALSFDYDAAAAVLRVTVTNTSRVFAGVPNPLITEIWFCAPAGTVDRARLVEQSTGGGTQPFDLAFDADTAAGKHPLAADCFGLFNFQLAVKTRRGAIANAAADTIATPSGTAAVGPAQFTLQLDGPAVHGLSSAAFAAASSRGGKASVNGALHFVAGSKANEEGTIASADACRTGLFLRGTPQIGHDISICVAGSNRCHATLLASAVPGPFTIFGITLPIGLPLIAWFDLGDFTNGTTELSLPVSVPNHPALVGLEFYLANMTHPWGMPDQFAFSPAYAITVQ
jgi:hypothetical protein